MKIVFTVINKSCIPVPSTFSEPFTCTNGKLAIEHMQETHEMTEDTVRSAMGVPPWEHTLIRRRRRHGHANFPFRASAMVAVNPASPVLTVIASFPPLSLQCNSECCGVPISRAAATASCVAGIPSME